MSSNLGAVPSQTIREMISAGYIRNAEISNVQPASLDLVITETIYRMKGTFLPREHESIESFFPDGALYKTNLDQPLELDGIYLIKLKESVHLPPYMYAYTNNKSTTGRINLQTRLVASGVSRFDFLPQGFYGDLWLEVIPKSFPIKLCSGAKLNQMRFFTGDTRLNHVEMEMVFEQYKLIYDRKGNPIEKPEKILAASGITLTVDLDTDLVGYKCASSSNKFLDFRKDNEIDPLDFFEPIFRPRNGQLCLRRNEFYILFTKEYLRVPPQFAAEMVAYDPSKGEYRSHSAGFFDPGFGYGEHGEIHGTPGVLEVFSHDNDFILRDGQPICKVVYERVIELPDSIYGSGKMRSHYGQQRGPKLSRHFRTYTYESSYTTA